MSRKRKSAIDRGEPATVTPAEAPTEEPTTPKEEANPMEEFKQQLLALGVSETAIQTLFDQELASAEALEGMTYERLTAMGIKAGSAKILAEKFGSKATATTTAEASPTAAPTMASMDILPAVPDDVSFVEMLKVGGVLKIQPVDVIAAMRAAIASQVGLYQLPDIIMKEMEKFANEQEEPVGPNFYELQKLITTRDYGDILHALGINGAFVSERRKKEVLQRINTLLWPALHGFHGQLNAWSDSWAKGMANPAIALTALAMMSTGNRGALPPGMMQTPETAGLRDEAETVINKINKVFAGAGIPVARALGYEATRIKGILEEPSLPAALGATSKDQMLKALGISVGADYVRLERNVIRYALAIMELPKVTSGNEEYSYLSAMLTLGLAIPWDKLEVANPKEVRPRPGEGFRNGRDL